MARQKRTNSKKQILPDSLHSFLARRIIDSLSLGILGLGAFLLVTIFTYNRNDPSMNIATSSDGTHNLGGLFGANIADILLQSFGFGALMLGLLPIIFSEHS